MTNLDDIKLPSSDKIQNDGATSQGKATANEWNMLVRAMSAIKTAVAELRNYIDDKTKNEIVVDSSLDEQSQNPISNDVVTSNFNFLRQAISNLFTKTRTKKLEVLNSKDATILSAEATSSDYGLISSRTGVVIDAQYSAQVRSSSTQISGTDSAVVYSEGVAAMATEGAYVSVDAETKKAKIVGDDTEFTYRTKNDDGGTEEHIVTLKNILLGGELITYDQFKNIKKKEMITYYIAKDEEALRKNKCWRIYLRSQLIGQFDVEGNLTLPVFPMRFPFRLA